MKRGAARGLLILRHAKAVGHGESPTDFARGLTARGRRDASRVGHWLRSMRLVPDCVVSSTAVRAKETTELVVAELGTSALAVRWERRVYEAGVRTLLAVLADCPATSRLVLLVGHNPGIEDLTIHLGGDSVQEPPNGKLLPTAALAHLQISGTWKAPEPGSGRLLTIVRPKELE